MKRRNNINPKNLTTIPEYANMMGVTVQTVYNWLKEGRVVKLKFLGKYFIDKTSYKG